MLYYIDIFAGAGGLSEGFTRCGMKAVAHIEMNKAACNTLKTRECYYYLKNNGKADIYNDYLRGKISRKQLYDMVPENVTSTVINETMRMDGMPGLYAKIDRLMETQGAKNIDILVGGPPCQAYSLVGRARSSDGMASDPRNDLYRLYQKVLVRYQPEMFVFENVPGLLTAKKGYYLAQISKVFDESGYDLKYEVLNAGNFNVLQNRKRVILIGWKKGTKHRYPLFPVHDDPTVMVSSLFNDLPPLEPGTESNRYVGGPTEYLRETGIRKKDDILTWHIARPNIERDREIYRSVIREWNDNRKRIKYTDLPERLCTHRNRKAFLDRFKVVAADTHRCQTMVAHIAKDGHYFIHPDIEQARSLSVREAARVQSFPDDFFFEGGRTAAFMQIGNAVPPLMAYGIAQEIKKQFYDSSWQI